VSFGGLPMELGSAPVSVPMDVLGDVPVVRAGVEHGQIRLGLMSLGRVNLITPAATDRLGLTIEPTRLLLVTNREVVGQPEGVASVPTMNLGGVELRDFRAFVYPLHALVPPTARKGTAASQLAEVPYDALAGVGILAQSLADLDFPGRKLTLSHGDLPDVDNAEVLQMLLGAGKMMVPLRVGDKTIWANVQTASPAGLVIPGDQQSNFPGSGSGTTLVRIPGRAGPIEIRGGPLRVDVSLGRHVLRRPYTIVVGAGLERPFIGMGLLRQMDVTLDMANRRIRFRRVGTGPIELGPPPDLQQFKPSPSNEPLDEGTASNSETNPPVARPS
jgi:hypothetical protein